jgi:hypothetical protein
MNLLRFLCFVAAIVSSGCSTLIKDIYLNPMQTGASNEWTLDDVTGHHGVVISSQKHYEYNAKIGSVNATLFNSNWDMRILFAGPPLIPIFPLFLIDNGTIRSKVNFRVDYCPKDEKYNYRNIRMVIALQNNKEYSSFSNEIVYTKDSVRCEYTFDIPLSDINSITLHIEDLNTGNKSPPLRFTKDSCLRYSAWN